MDDRSKLLASVGGLANFSSAFDARSFRRDRHLAELADAERSLERGRAAIQAVADKAGAAEWAAELAAEWVDGYVLRWGKYQAAGRRCMSWAIVGPSNFPVRRNQKRLDVESNRAAELIAWSQGVRGWAERRIKRGVAAELGPVGVASAELQAARANLAAREARAAMMIAANAIVRKVAKLEPAAAIAKAVELGKAAGVPVDAAIAAAWLKPNYMNRVVAFEGFELSNNSAEIRRMRGRVEQLERREAAIVASVAGELEDKREAIGDVELVQNVELQRVQLIFPGKPAPAIIAELKGRGFRWAPSAGAWQRQLNLNGLDAARAVLAKIERQARGAEQLEQMAAAPDSFAAFWAGSASQSVANDYAAGRVVDVIASGAK